MSVLRSLPVDIKQQLSGKEARAFLYGEELPDELLEKLKDYIMKGVIRGFRKVENHSCRLQCARFHG